MYPEEIREDAYRQFIRNHFSRNSRNVDPGAIAEILALTRRHTGYTQYFCNKLYDSGVKVDKKNLQQI
ncbi:MAG TPA: hypothetical protein VMC08_02855 [Bacteroidales bacterium]|nr:hypothetical protein [Bacteroidales bacterium]